jgi:hypothetical protein
VVIRLEIYLQEEIHGVGNNCKKVDLRLK